MPVHSHQVVGCYLDPLLAHIVRARLETEGIAAILADDHLLETNPLLAPAVGGVSVLVPADQLAAAQAVLQALEAGAYALDSNMLPQDDTS